MVIRVVEGGGGVVIEFDDGVGVGVVEVDGFILIVGVLLDLGVFSLGFLMIGLGLGIVGVGVGEILLLLYF